MDFLRVCRICSVMDVKMHDLRSYPLNFFYEFVIGSKPLACNLPPYACYECAALVSKFYNFRQKCLRNQDVLNEITAIYGKFGDAIDETNPEECVEVKTVETTKKKHRRGAFKHVTMLSNPSLSAEDMDDFDQYINVLKLTVKEQKEEVRKRKQSSNYLNSPYRCKLCYKGFINNNAWNHHVSKHSESAGSLKCGICKIRFKTKRAYQQHVLGHEKKYACKFCTYVSTNTTQAKQHLGWHKGVTYECKYCGESFNKLGLAMHKTMMHKDLQDKPEDGPYCGKCDMRFVSSAAYKRHIAVSVKHTQNTDSVFTQSNSRKLHVRTVHLKQPAPYISRRRSKRLKEENMEVEEEEEEKEDEEEEVQEEEEVLEDEELMEEEVLEEDVE
ncbi:hypothetical protein HF086_009274 [Spodoptera exigua]|uniref:Uncharacterized protein n=1 Tax=Spodoptera exigua TaxID=7107 RepID=A0A922SDV9_SPOEX|nr:hypothetical protein HF086_009274 [Spodoptera exigua]